MSRFCSTCYAVCETCCECWHRCWPLTPQGGETECTYQCKHGGTCGVCVYSYMTTYDHQCSNCCKVVCDDHAASLDYNSLCIICRVDKSDGDSICIYPTCDNMRMEPEDGVTCSRCKDWACSTHDKAIQSVHSERLCDSCLC